MKRLLNWIFLQLDKQLYANILDKRLTLFLSTGQRNAWIEVNLYGKVFVRRSVRAVGMDELFSALDIAAIEFKPTYRGKGFFKKTLKVFEKNARQIGLSALYVECIHEPRLHAHLLRQGFKEMPIDKSSVYRRIKT